MDIKPLVGLLGVLIAALMTEFNDQVTSIALVDVRGGLGITWPAKSAVHVPVLPFKGSG